jgi:hypothetical protein
MLYPKSNGLTWELSLFSTLQSVSFPGPIMTGSVEKFLPSDVRYKLASQKNGVETYSGAWSNPMSKGKAVVSIGADGRLLHFEQFSSSPEATIHRIMDFANYVINPPTSGATFSTIPPIGLSSYQFDAQGLAFEIGDPVHLGTWKSQSGSVDMDARARGKLVIVREPGSLPSDALVSFLQGQKLSVETIVASVGDSGGQVWSPAPDVRAKLSAVGTPLLILFGSDGKVKQMWFGFDSDNPMELVNSINAAVKQG